MCELYLQMGGDNISKYTDGLRQAQQDTLSTKFAEIDENNGRPTKQAKKLQQPERRTTIETNIGKSGKTSHAPLKTAGAGGMGMGGGGGPPLDQQHASYVDEMRGDGGVGDRGPVDSTKQCDFCGRFDPAFTEESMDIHYWKECPVLTCCWECD